MGKPTTLKSWELDWKLKMVWNAQRPCTCTGARTPSGQKNIVSSLQLEVVHACLDASNPQPDTIQRLYSLKGWGKQVFISCMRRGHCQPIQPGCHVEKILPRHLDSTSALLIVGAVIRQALLGILASKGHPRKRTNSKLFPVIELDRLLSLRFLVTVQQSLLSAV